MARTVDLASLFEEEKRAGISLFLGGRPTVEYVELSDAERAAIDRCINQTLAILRKTAPSLASEFERHRSIFHKFGGIAKGIFPEAKPIQFPSQAGGIGVNPIIPQAIKYAATPSSDYPCYTSYTTNKWTIDLTAGTAAYIFGNGTNYYKASPTTNKHALIVVMQHGLVEIGSTPSIIQQKLWTQAESKYGIWATHPVAEIPIEPNKTIYQYNTIGVIPVYHDFGIQWGILPMEDKTATLKLIGLVFYEHDFLSDLTWIS